MAGEGFEPSKAEPGDLQSPGKNGILFREDVRSNFDKGCLDFWCHGRRSAAAAVDRYLAGETQLPAPIEPTTRQLTV